MKFFIKDCGVVEGTPAEIRELMGELKRPLLKTPLLKRIGPEALSSKAKKRVVKSTKKFHRYPITGTFLSNVWTMHTTGKKKTAQTLANLLVRKGFPRRTPHAINTVLDRIRSGHYQVFGKSEQQQLPLKTK